MSKAQQFIVTFKDVPSYEKYKEQVLAGGGTIVNDLGTTILGFTANIPFAVLQLMQSSVVGDSITSLEPDSVVSIKG